MKINNNRYVNFAKNETEKEKKSTNAETAEKESKTGGSDALSFQGRAFINILKKKNPDKPDIVEYHIVYPDVKDLSDEEFQEYENKLREKIETLPESFKKTTESWKINKSNIFVADRIVSDSRLYSNDNIQENAENILNRTEEHESAQAKIDLINKFLSDSKLYKNENVNSQIGNILNYAKSLENSAAHIYVIDKILENSKLYNNGNVKKNMGNIIFHSSNLEYSKAKTDIMDKFLSDPKLYDNKNMEAEISDIIFYTDEEKEAKLKINLMNKFLSNPIMFDNENVRSQIGTIIKKLNTPEECLAKINLAYMILNTPRLSGNKNIQSRLGDMLYDINKKEEFETKIDLLDKIFSNYELKNSDTVKKTMGCLLLFTNNPKQIQQNIDIIKMLESYNLSNEKSLNQCAENMLEIADSTNIKTMKELFDEFNNHNVLECNGSGFIISNIIKIKKGNYRNSTPIVQNTKTLEKNIKERFFSDKIYRSFFEDDNFIDMTEKIGLENISKLSNDKLRAMLSFVKDIPKHNNNLS